MPEATSVAALRICKLIINGVDDCIRRIHHPSGVAPLGTPVRARFCKAAATGSVLQAGATALGSVGDRLAIPGCLLKISSGRRNFSTLPGNK